MATNGTSPSGGGRGGAGGKMTLDQIIFKGLSSNPAKITVSPTYPCLFLHY
jgi:hypothetical protein